MNIRYFAKTHIPSNSANSIQVVNTIHSFTKFCEKVFLYIPFHYKRYILNTFRVIFRRYGKSYPKNLKIIFLKKDSNMQYENSAINYIKKTSQTQDLFYTRSFLIANFLVQNNNHFIYESHVFEKDFHNPYFINFINLISKQHNGKIVAISDYIYLNYIKNGLLKNKIKVFPDGVDKKFFNLGTATRKQVIAQLFKDTNIYNKKIVLYTGSLRKEKGIFFLLKAAEQIPELNFVVIGGKAKEVTYIKRQIQTNNFFIHHAVEYKYIPLLLLESDILIMPYLKKGELIKSMSPLKLFEYLASGKPLLASNLPAFENILKDEVNAFLFMPESIESLRRTIHKVLSLSSQQLNLIKEHQIATASKYTWDNRVKEILTWYYKG